MEYTELQWREAILLGVGIREGLIRAVADGYRSVEEVARELGFDERAVGVVLSALSEMGIVEERAGEFRLVEEHRGPLLEPGHPGYAGGSVVHRFQMIRGWSQLPEILASGEPAEDRSGRNHRDAANFTHAMRRGASESAFEVARGLLGRLGEGARILDIGGGPGVNAEAFARAGAKVTVLDLPEVIEVTAEELRAAGIETVAKDMNEGLPQGPFDAVYIGNVSHIYGPRKNRELFKRVHGVLGPKGVICVKDFVAGRSADAARFAVNMLVFTPEGGTYTEAEYRRWLSEAGFEEVELEAVPGKESFLVLARKSR